MPLLQGAQRLWTPAAPPGGPIVGKPTVPFSPNENGLYYPNYSACFLTNLIAGQSAYVEDSIPARGDITQAGGSYGQFAYGEGYQVVVAGNTVGAIVQVGDLYTEQIAMLIEFAMTNDDPNFTYLMGWRTNHQQSIGPKNANCSNEGIFYLSSSYVCLGDIAGDTLHRLCIRGRRGDAVTNSITVALDGIIIHDEHPLDLFNQSNPFYLGRNQNGRSQTLFVSGVWHWAIPYNDPGQPLSDQAMIDLTTDPWPHLAKLA